MPDTSVQRAAARAHAWGWFSALVACGSITLAFDHLAGRALTDRLVESSERQLRLVARKWTVHPSGAVGLLLQAEAGPPAGAELVAAAGALNHLVPEPATAAGAGHGGPQIVKAHLIRRDGTIACSIDPTRVGQSAASEAGFRDALEGRVASAIVDRERIVTLQGPRADVDVFETCLPIMAADGTIIGTAELYGDVGAARSAMDSLRLQFTAAALAFVVLLLLVVTAAPRRVQRALRQAATLRCELAIRSADAASALAVARAADVARQAADASKERTLRLLGSLSHEVRTPRAGAIGMLGLAVDDAARGNGTRLIGHLAAGMPKSVMADRLRLAQTLDNLISNAVKFTRHGTVSVQVGRSSDRPARGSIEVIDTGIGIDAGRLQAVLDPFELADPTIRTRFGGSGLGLGIVRGIVNAMGGRLRLTSEAGRGTTGRVELPVMVAQSATDFQESGFDAGSLPAAQRRVLPVEDDPVNRMVATELLRGLALDLGSADTVAEGAA